MGQQKKKYLNFQNGSSIEFFNEEGKLEPFKGTLPLPDWMMYYIDILRHPYWSPIMNIPTQQKCTLRFFYGNDHQTRSEETRQRTENHTTSYSQEFE